MATHTIADPSNPVHSLLREVARQYHPLLLAHDVTIAVLFADEVKHHGYPARAKIKINSLISRTEGLTDATLTIDEGWWEEATDAQRNALLDHELAHLRIVIKDGSVKTDNAGRPKLKMRQHDLEMGVFFEIAERHGEDSGEVDVWKSLNRELHQRGLFDLVEGVENAVA